MAGWKCTVTELIRFCDLAFPRNHSNLFQNTNPIFPDHLGDEDQCHDVHNGQTTSHHTHHKEYAGVEIDSKQPYFEA